MNIPQAIEGLGLKKRSAKVFLATLELGSGSILAISRKAGMPRSTCEAILESLRVQGFVSPFYKKKVRCYAAEDPRKVIRFAQERVQGFEQALPHMLALYGQTAHLPSARLYEGRQGCASILDEILNEAHEILSFSYTDDVFSVFAQEFPAFVKSRVSKKIPTKVIAIDSPLSRERQALGVSQLREMRLLPKSLEFHSLLMVWENKMAMFSLKGDLFALVTESEQLANIQRAMFNIIWETLPSPHKITPRP